MHNKNHHILPNHSNRKVILSPRLTSLLVAAAWAFAFVAGSGAANAQTCVAPPAVTATYGQVKSTISVTTAGTYKIWSRIRVADTTNNSYNLQVNSVSGTSTCNVFSGNPSTTTAGSWIWAPSTTASPTLAAGSYQVVMSGTKAAVQLDRILFLTDQTCVPVAGTTGDNCVNTGDTTKPTVSLTSPASGSSVTVGNTVNVAATASDNVGVTKVEFYDGSSLIKTFTASPYTYAWNTATVGAGSHTLTAKAYDAAGNVTASGPVNISLLGNTGVVIPGDVDGDGHVNGTDIGILITHDGQNYAPADFNHDGTVGAADIAIVLAHWTW